MLLGVNRVHYLSLMFWVYFYVDLIAHGYSVKQV